jgi:hypothetical protein
VDDKLAALRQRLEALKANVAGALSQQPDAPATDETAPAVPAPAGLSVPEAVGFSSNGHGPQDPP